MGELVNLGVNDDYLDTPNCARCLVPMEPSGDPGAEVWKCADCGLVRLP